MAIPPGEKSLMNSFGASARDPVGGLSAEPAIRCFKYRTFQSAIQCLENGTLYFARPNRLNDVLEGRFDDCSYEAFVATVQEAVSEASMRRGEDSLQIDRGAFSAQAREAFGAENQRFRAAAANTGIFSAAARPDNAALWASYADEHRGVCFELCWTSTIMHRYQLEAAPVRYDASPRTFNRAAIWREIFSGVSDEMPPPASVRDIFQMTMTARFRELLGRRTVISALSTKHPDWQHEEEIRIFAPRGDVAVAVLPEVLRRVYFVNPPETYNRQRSGREKYRQSFERINQLLATRYPNVGVSWGSFQHGAVHFEHQPMTIHLVPESALSVDPAEVPFLSFLDVPRNAALSPHEALDPPEKLR